MAEDYLIRRIKVFAAIRLMPAPLTILPVANTGLGIRQVFRCISHGKTSPSNS